MGETGAVCIGMGPDLGALYQGQHVAIGLLEMQLADQCGEAAGQDGLWAGGSSPGSET